MHQNDKIVYKKHRDAAEVDLGLLQHPRWSGALCDNIITKRSILDVAAVLDPPLCIL